VLIFLVFERIYQRDNIKANRLYQVNLKNEVPFLNLSKPKARIRIEILSIKAIDSIVVHNNSVADFSEGGDTAVYEN